MHVIMWILHIMCLVFGVVGLVITIPLHIIITLMLKNAKSNAPPRQRGAQGEFRVETPPGAKERIIRPPSELSDSSRGERNDLDSEWWNSKKQRWEKDSSGSFPGQADVEHTMPKSKVPYLFLAIIVLIMVLTLSAVRETDAPAVKDLRSLDVDSIRTPAESYHAVKTQELQQLPGEEEKSPGRSRKKTGVASLASLKKEAIENALQPCFN